MPKPACIICNLIICFPCPFGIRIRVVDFIEYRNDYRYYCLCLGVLILAVMQHLDRPVTKLKQIRKTIYIPALCKLWPLQVTHRYQVYLFNASNGRGEETIFTRTGGKCCGFAHESVQWSQRYTYKKRENTQRPYKRQQTVGQANTKANRDQETCIS